MISLDECKKILNKNGKKYKDDEVKAIMKFLVSMAEIQLMYEKTLLNLND